MVSLALKISLVFVVVVGETKLLIYVLRRLQGVIMFGYLRCLLGHQRSVYNTAWTVHLQHFYYLRTKGK